MTIKTFGILAAAIAFSTASAPSFAADDEIVAPDQSGVEAAVPAPIRCEPWMRNCRAPQPPRRNFTCFARNVTGRTFSAYGNWRTPRYYVQQRALQLCQNQSLPLIRRTCRMIGCR